MADHLSDFEQVIYRGRTGFIESGVALMHIRYMRLYRETHRTFEDYCRERWSISKAYANRLINSSRILDNLLLPDDTLGYEPILPMNECQARSLMKLENPALQRKVWIAALKNVHDGKVTARDIECAIRSLAS